MDLLRQKRQAGTLCSNNAKSCYDQIVHSVATLSMRRLGASPNGVKSRKPLVESEQRLVYQYKNTVMTGMNLYKD